MLRAILAVIFPPLYVVGYGCGSILIVLISIFAGWIPGIIAALIIINKKK
ncbi:MAG: YqaE/Pmp3 family membrane protein [Sphingobacteriales bacterium]|nr:MAG: YqaE/Pmp3 family membrane protein [Sphingobacteriales bacterium]